MTLRNNCGSFPPAEQGPQFADEPNVRMWLTDLYSLGNRYEQAAHSQVGTTPDPVPLSSSTMILLPTKARPGSADEPSPSAFAAGVTITAGWSPGTSRSMMRSPSVTNPTAFSLVQESCGRVDSDLISGSSNDRCIRWVAALDPDTPPRVVVAPILEIFGLVAEFRFETVNELTDVFFAIEFPVRINSSQMIGTQGQIDGGLAFPFDEFSRNARISLSAGGWGPKNATFREGVLKVSCFSLPCRSAKHRFRTPSQCRWLPGVLTLTGILLLPMQLRMKGCAWSRSPGSNCRPI